MVFRNFFKPLFLHLEDRLTPQAGLLDPSFNLSGQQVIPFPDVHSCRDLAVQPDGKIVLAGFAGQIYFGQALATRLLPDGQLDSSFGNSGRLTFNFQPSIPSLDIVESVAMQGDKILIAGTTRREFSTGGFPNSNDDFAVARLNSDGTFDSTFGTNGRVVIPIDAGFIGQTNEDFVRDMVVDSAGRITLAGTSFSSGPRVLRAMSAVRLTPNGQLDTTFSGDGKAVFDFPGIEAEVSCEAAAIGPGGRIALAGSFSSRDHAVFVLTESGDLDPSFGTSGRMKYDVFGNQAEEVLHAVTFDGSGRIVVGGLTRDASNQADAVILRLLPSGSLDTTFNGSGYRKFGIQSTTQTFDIVQYLDIDPVGNLIAAGSTAVPDGADLNYVGFLSRLTPDGQFDSKFGTNGTTVYDYFSLTGSRNAFPNGLEITPDGKILVAGTSYSTTTMDNVFTVSRFFGDTNTAPTISMIGNQTIQQGATPVPISFTVSDIETLAGNLIVSGSSSNPGLIANSQIVFGGSGTNRTVTLIPTFGMIGQSVITLTVTDSNLGTIQRVFQFEVQATPPFVGYSQFAVGAKNQFAVYNSDATLRYQLNLFPDQSAEIRTATADFTGDGIADIVIGTGPGGPSHVKIFDGDTQAELWNLDPFEASFTGGVYISAGDLNGDGVADFAVCPDQGGGPRVRVFDGRSFTQISDFFGIDDPNFRGGARTAIGDLNGDHFSDLIVVAGFGGGPRVAAFSGKSLSSNGGLKLFSDFFAFEQSLRNGIFVATGDINGDGFADIVAGGGPGGGPRVYILDGQSLVLNGSNNLVGIGNFFSGDTSNRGGVRVAVKDLDGDQRADILTSAGIGAGSGVKAFPGADIHILNDNPVSLFSFISFPGASNGVFVG